MEAPAPVTPSDISNGEHRPVRRSILENIVSLGSGELLARLVAFTGTAYLARVLGPEGFGIIGFALALTGYLSLSVRAGIASVGAREVAKKPEEAAHFAASVIKFRLIVAPIALVVLGVTAWFLPKPDTVKLVVFLSGLSFLTLALDTSWVHKGLEDNRRVAVAMVITQAIYVFLLFALVRESDDVTIVPIALVVGQFTAAVFLAVPIFRRGTRSGSLLDGWHIFRDSSYLIVTKLLRVLLFTFDIVLLGFLIGEREVGLYSAVYRVCHMLVALSSAVMFSYLPEFSRAVQSGHGHVSDVISRSLQLSMALSIPLIVGGILVAQPLIELVYGLEYVEGTLAFQFLLVAVSFIFVKDTIHNVLLAYDRLRTETLIVGAAVALNIALNVWMIPIYGLAGAAAATLAAEGLIIVLGFIVVRRLGSWPRFAPLSKILVAVACMTAVVLALEGVVPLLVRIGAGGISYVFALIAVRGVPQDVLPQVQKLLPFIRS